MISVGRKPRRKIVARIKQSQQMTDRRQNGEVTLRDQLRFETAKGGWKATKKDDSNKPYDAKIM
jgi:hypothetical protein